MAAAVDVKRAPARMRSCPNWVLWRWKLRNGRPDKPPYRVNAPRRLASSTDPATWATYDEAVAAYDPDRDGGIGFVLTDTPFTGVDLDHVRDADAKVTIPAAEKIVAAFDTYCELSPSGSGIHIICEGEMPADVRNKVAVAGGKKVPGGWEIEVYSTGRYFTFTGASIGKQPEVRACQPALDELVAAYFTEKPAPILNAAGQRATIGELQASDAQLIEMMMASQNGKFARVWGGNWEDEFGSQSDADLWMCGRLCFYTWGDASRMDALFRQSGLMREKWDSQRGEKTYGAMTISTAIAGHRGDYYKGKLTAPPDEDDGIAGETLQAAAADPQDEPAVTFHLTELGNAERLAARYKGSVYAVRGSGELRAYDRRRGIYTADSGLLLRYAKDVVRRIYAETATVTGSEDERTKRRKDIASHAARSESKRALEAMLGLAQAMVELEAEAEDFDANPELLNSRSHVIDLASGAAHPHDPKYRMTKVAGCGYTPGAATPMWDAFLARIFDGDAELIAFVQRLFGYALTGYIGEQIFAIFHGAGANGKSVLVDVMQAAMGDYAGVAALKTFLPRSNDAVRTDLATLNGRRLVSTSESEPGKLIDAATIKVLTSKHVTCRFNYAKGETTYTPQYLVILDTNFKPQVQCDDYAIKRRVLLVPFDVLIPDAEQDKKLTEKLIDAELPGILAWAVAGAVDYLRNGLRIPEKVRVATDAYRCEMDALHDFWARVLAFGEPQKWTTAEALREALEAWGRENGIHKEDLPKGTEWGRQLRERGARSDKKWLTGKTVSVWFGVQIVGADEQEELI